MPGYSKRSLVEKLGVKEGDKVLLINPPEKYKSEFSILAGKIDFVEQTSNPVNFIQFFTKSKEELVQEFPKLKSILGKNGMFWVSWPKGSAKIATEVNENMVRLIGLDAGLVDVKVAAIDEIWSGLKFVFRLVDR